MNVKCPNCGESYYAEKYSTRTAMYFPAIYKDGVNQNPDGNITTTECECLNCHHLFSYSTQYGKLKDIVLGKKVTPVQTLNTPINVFENDDPAKYLVKSTLTASREDIRDAEIKRLERQIESLQQQLLEVKANPTWEMRITI